MRWLKIVGDFSMLLLPNFTDWDAPGKLELGEILGRGRY
jgi:hypothetical protein